MSTVNKLSEVFLMKDGNFYVIQSFMMKDLKLKPNEALIYAIIYGFSQDNQTTFRGSIRYLMENTNLSKQTVLNILKDLTQKKYIIKLEKVNNGVKFCEYKANLDILGSKENVSIVKELDNPKSVPVVQNLDQSGQKNIPNSVQNFDQGGTNFRHNNIDNNIDNNIKDNIAPVEATPQTPVVEKDSKVDDKSFKSKKENIFEDFANGNTQLLQALRDFEESRIKNRKKMTDKAKQLLISRLKSFSSNPYDWIAMLENAILNGWQTVYELNGNQQRVASGYQPRYDEWNWGNNNGNM